jgi:hypothetical protein
MAGYWKNDPFGPSTHGDHLPLRVLPQGGKKMKILQIEGNFQLVYHLFFCRWRLEKKCKIFLITGVRFLKKVVDQHLQQKKNISAKNIFYSLGKY